MFFFLIIIYWFAVREAIIYRWEMRQVLPLGRQINLSGFASLQPCSVPAGCKQQKEESNRGTERKQLNSVPAVDYLSLRIWNREIIVINSFFKWAEKYATWVFLLSFISLLILKHLLCDVCVHMHCAAMGVCACVPVKRTRCPFTGLPFSHS